MDKFKSSLLFQCLIFVIPLNIYMWGDWLLVNIQWALFRFQQSELGDSLMLPHKDLLYIYRGQNTGIYNIAAAGFWTIGAIVLFIGLIITIYSYIEEEISLLRKASYFTIAGGVILGISAVFRFHGGFAIPVGIPVILVAGWWIYQTSADDDESNEGEIEPGDDLQELSES